MHLRDNKFILCCNREQGFALVREEWGLGKWGLHPFKGGKVVKNVGFPLNGLWLLN